VSPPIRYDLTYWSKQPPRTQHPRWRSRANSDWHQFFRLHYLLQYYLSYVCNSSYDPLKSSRQRHPKQPTGNGYESRMYTSTTAASSRRKKTQRRKPRPKRDRTSNGTPPEGQQQQCRQNEKKSAFLPGTRSIPSNKRKAPGRMNNINHQVGFMKNCFSAHLRLHRTSRAFPASAQRAETEGKQNIPKP
jgi:hypothetical protein